MKTSVLITGATGFVGRSLIRVLSREKEFELHVLARDSRKAKDLAGYGVNIHEGDTTKPETLKRPLEGKDAVIHCAALMSNFDSQPRERFYEVNALGTKTLLDACDDALKQFLHVSTAGVYGSTGKEAAGEETPYGRALSDYEWSKKESELMVLKQARDRKIPFTILRPSQLYGCGMRYGWPQTIMSVKDGSMLMPGEGLAMVHPLHIDDFVRAVNLALLNEAAVNGIYNIAGPAPVKMAELFDTIARILGVEPPRTVPYPPVYWSAFILSLVPRWIKGPRLGLLTPHRVPFFADDHLYDITKAGAELGFNPVVEIKDGFRGMIDCLKADGLI